MKQTLPSVLIAFTVILAVMYCSGYLYLKYESYSRVMVPSDPWKSSRLTARSRVSYWGAGLPRSIAAGNPLPHRDPGLGLDRTSGELLNIIYHPVHILDENITGWSVKFRPTDFQGGFDRDDPQ